MPQTVSGEGFRDFSEPRFFEGTSLADVATIRTPVDKAHVIIAPTPGGSLDIFKFSLGDTTADDGINVIAPLNSTVHGRWRRVTLTNDINVRTFGAVGDGVTDDSAAFTRAIAAAPTKSIILVPPGTYLLNTVIVNKDLLWQLNGATLLHKAAPSHHMLRFTVGQTFGFFGGILDGNSSNQPPYPANRYILMYYYGDGATIANVRFQHYMLAAISDHQSTTYLRIDNCDFIDGAEHGGTYDPANAQYSTAIDGTYFTANTNAHLQVTNCYFNQSAAPSALGKGPGGIIVSGLASANANPSVTIAHNYFNRIGQEWPLVTGNAIGPIQLYDECIDTLIQGNSIFNSGYTPIVMENCGRVTCCDNIIDGSTMDPSNIGDGLIFLNPSVRAGHGDIYDSYIISGNMLKGDGSDGLPGIRVTCDGGTVRRLAIVNNFMTGCRGLQIVNVSSRTIVDGNEITANMSAGGGSSGGIEFQNFTGVATITNNHVTATGLNAVANLNGCTTGTFYFAGNNLQATGAYPMLMGGVGSLNIVDGVFNQTSTLANIVLGADGSGNPITALTLSPSIVTNGPLTIDFTKITAVIGRITYTGTPEGVVTAGLGVEYFRAEAAYTLHYIKQTASGNTGWSVVNDQTTTSHGSNYTATLNEHYIGVGAASPFTVTLPSPVGICGKEFVFCKNDLTTTVVSVTDGTSIWRLSCPTQSLRMRATPYSTWLAEDIGNLKGTRTFTGPGGWTVTDSDNVMLLDSTGGAFVIVLPACSTHAGQTYVFKKISADASNCTLTPAGSDKIDGAATKVLSTQYDKVTITSNGTGWFITA